MINLKFYELPIEKQNRILNAGYRVFSAYPYKKAPVSVIAEEAGVSKSLLFHYFVNKKAYYQYLYSYANDCINRVIEEEGQKRNCDFFETMLLEINRKVELLGKYPYLYQFIQRAYYETEPSLQDDLNKLREEITIDTVSKIKDSIDISKFKYPEEIDTLINIVMCSAEGYTYQNRQVMLTEPNRIVEEFQAMLNSLKHHYYKEDYIDVFR
ncbi:TetR/AcrR family transcriptional regulator [Alkaliphilus peptidifermentans]|uniref:Transcriptional regulator, TetR family n=1 Tax=Alkaliphilus peptidifermentans DSM 18978 TaxID=1120976 RepID=A0A1G5KTR0_9FIRM|nr:TetR/AcrR family transcriptional regulator [Alkaliphilus peptidifermentans]SCZ03997.1 transcriptional regulator, TetR family [Alkaliphilus peptidifermentans DSM 18978]